MAKRPKYATIKMEKQDLLQAVFEEATIGILLVNKQGEIVEVNPFAAKLFGYTIEELLAQKIEILIPNAYRSKHVKHRQNYHQHPSPRLMGMHFDLYGQCKDGTQFPVEISLSYMKKKGEQLAIAYVNDDTSKRNMMQANKDISKIVEESLNEIFIFDAETLQFLQVNKGARQNIGYSMEEMEDLTPIDIKLEYEEAAFRTRLEPLRTGTKEKIQFESIHQRKDRTTYPVEVHIQYSSLGTQAVYVAIILDISKRKKNEQAILEYSSHLEEKVEERTQELAANELKLKEALKKEQELGQLKSRFVSMASHEFRTPLSSILSSADLIGLYKKEEQQSKRMKHVNRIASSVGNLITILNDFLSLEKLESGIVQTKPVVLDLRAYIPSVLDEMNMIKSGSQEIKFEHSGSDNIVADKHLLKNILINLLSNAIKYSPQNKDVVLRTKKENSVLIIEVQDYGIGIPKADQGYMFTRFFRATNVENIQGTGLGLTIVKRYLDLMKGTISFESEENVGTIFRVEIPQ